MTRDGVGNTRDGTQRFTVFRSSHAKEWNTGAHGSVPSDYSGPFYDRPDHPEAKLEIEALNGLLASHYPEERYGDPWRIFEWCDTLGWVDVSDGLRTHPEYGECPT